MKWIRRISYMDMLFLLFLTGSVCGCAAANLLSRELLEQIGSFDHVIEKGYVSWTSVMKKRMTQIGTGCLISMTPLGTLVYAGLAFFAGSAIGVLISVCTLYGGWLGLWWFLRKMLPHWACYVPVWLILAACVKEKPRIRVWGLVLAFSVIGMVMETLFSL